MILLIIFSIIAIVKYKSGKAWFWYGIGLILSILSTIGMLAQKNIAFIFNKESITMWVSLMAVAIVFAAIIMILTLKNKKDMS